MLEDYPLHRPAKTLSERHLRLLTRLHTDEAANDLREQYSQ